MIPIERILKAEKQARSYGYKTTITNGGEYFECIKYPGKGDPYSLKIQNDNILLGIPHQFQVTVSDLEEHIKEQQQLLELANMLQTPEQKISKTMFDFNNDGTTGTKT